MGFGLILNISQAIQVIEWQYYQQTLRMLQFNLDYFNPMAVQSKTQQWLLEVQHGVDMLDEHKYHIFLHIKFNYCSQNAMLQFFGYEYFIVAEKSLSYAPTLKILCLDLMGIVIYLMTLLKISKFLLYAIIF